MIPLFVLVLASVNVDAQNFSCPNENYTFYYADISTGCQVYHFCENFELKTQACPPDQAFDYLTSKCENADNVTCYEILKFRKHTPTNVVEIESDEHARSKRHSQLTSDHEHFLYSFANSLLKIRIRSSATVLFGTNNAMVNQVFLPTIFKMLDVSASRRELFTLYFSAKSSLEPIKWEMLRQQALHGSDYSKIEIHREYFERSMSMFLSETRATFSTLAYRHLPEVMQCAFANLPAIFDGIHRMKMAKYQYVDELQFHVVRFVRKYRRHFRSSTTGKGHIFSNEEVLRDLRQIEKILLKVTVEYFSHNPTLIINVLFKRELLSQEKITVRGSYGHIAHPIRK